VDVNGDTLHTEKDKVIIGDPNPDFTFSFTKTRIQRVRFKLLFYGSYGNDIFNTSKSSWYNATGLNNWTKDALNAYRDPVYDADGNMIDPGNTTSDQFALRNTTNDNYSYSDWYVEDGSYVKLKTVQLDTHYQKR
jgi:hypothetical protein